MRNQQAGGVRDGHGSHEGLTLGVHASALHARDSVVLLGHGTMKQKNLTGLRATHALALVVFDGQRLARDDRSVVPVEHVVEFVHGGDGELFCCGQAMVKLAASTADSATVARKHSDKQVHRDRSLNS